MKKVKILYSVSLNKRGIKTSLWFPLPLDSDYQKLISLDYEGNYSESDVFKKGIYHAPMLYAEWKGEEIKEIKVRIEAEIPERNNEWSKVKRGESIPEGIKILLMPTKHIQ